MFDLSEVRSQLQEQLAQARATGAGASLAEWVGLVGACQEVLNVASAVQTVALAHVAAIEDVDQEDGTVAEEFRGLGHQRLDAPALVSEPLGLSAAAATSRMEHAVDLASRHPRVVAAMGEGRVDAYRAGIISTELAAADREVCAEVVARVEPHLGREPGPALRRRVRQALHGVDAGVLRRAAERARADRSLRRYVAAPGVDEWSARLPVEQSRAAWSAVDDLARRYVHEGRCTGIEQARAEALMDLIEARATGEVSVQLAVPASEVFAQSRPWQPEEDMVAVAGFGLPGVTHVRRSWLTGITGRAAGTVVAVACDDETGALLSGPLGVDAATVRRAERHLAAATASRSTRPEVSGGSYRPPQDLVDFVKARDGSCRFPGCSVSARFCDVDHVVPWPVGATSAVNLACLCRRHHRVKQRRRWSVRLGPDASMLWTDPTGRRHTTAPLDHLHREERRLDEPAGERSASRDLPLSDGRSPSPDLPAERPELPSVAEEALADLLETGLVELACDPRVVTARNRTRLRLGRPVNPAATRLPQSHLPDRHLRLEWHAPRSTSRLDRGYPARHAIEPGRRGPRRGGRPRSGDTDPPPF